jgi:hypothetical protein
MLLVDGRLILGGGRHVLLVVDHVPSVDPCSLRPPSSAWHFVECLQ